MTFILADHLTLPIMMIYRRYYGARMTAFLAATFHTAAIIAGYLVEILLGVAGLIPSERHAKIETAHPSWNYTTFSTSPS